MKIKQTVGLVAVTLGLFLASANAHELSARANVGTGDNVLVGGVIVEDRDCPDGKYGKATPFVIRALGPSLSEAGITGYLQDPQILFYDGEGNLIGGQMDYSEVDATTQFTIWSHGLAPEYIQECALYVLLLPGTYTAIVSGQDGGTGIALLEAYKL